MGQSTGKALPLSLARCLICDSLAISQPIPLAHAERRIDLGDLKAAVEALRPPIHWQLIFLKAYALVAAQRPALRRVYVARPWPYLYEHPVNIGSIIVTRKIDGDDGLLHVPISSPESRSLAELQQLFKDARHKPLEEIRGFRRHLRLGRLPGPLRRALYRFAMDWLPRTRIRFLGTFGMSVVASMGIATITTWAPWTSMLHYTPFDKDGSLFVRLAIDHRVLDGVEVALALQGVEKALNGPLLEEIRQTAQLRQAVRGKRLDISGDCAAA